jgi:DNA-binding NtrC family response regulator
MAQLTAETRTQARQAVEVLFVDDDPMQREVYGRRLDRNGCRVRLAECADDAATQVHERRPDVVVLDVAMPGRDGLNALQELLDIDAGLPIIIHTAYPAFADNFLAWAADAYIEKSSDISPLIRAINACTTPEAPAERKRQ